MKFLAAVYLIVLLCEYILTKHEAIKEGMSAYDWLIREAGWELESKSFQVFGLAFMFSPVGQLLMFGVIVAGLMDMFQTKKGA